MEILWLLRVTQKRMHTIRNDSMKYDRVPRQIEGRRWLWLYTHWKLGTGPGAPTKKRNLCTRRREFAAEVLPAPLNCRRAADWPCATHSTMMLAAHRSKP
ncbi:hypothetical protein IG631_16230 [Alternaria alternata]|nr:hypothetical protein IG631_16230 [Alternaria alternata]